MPISVERAKQHTAQYSTSLRGSPRYWPEFLFHAAPVQTAIKILQGGELVCRTSLPAIEMDVANQGALGNNPAAHPYVRLYFRPRTMFHMRTEGIKCHGEPNWQQAQMSVPIMFLLDAVSVLTRRGTGYTPRTFATGGLQAGFDEAAFNQIPFREVYHDAALAPDIGGDVRAKRMAEVVVPGTLPLEGNLKVILCRSQNDAETLKYMLGNERAKWEPKIRVEQIPKSIFFHRALYIKSITPTPNGLALVLKPSEEFRTTTCHLQIFNCAGNALLVDQQRFPIGHGVQQIPIAALENVTAIQISIDGSLAYRGPIEKRVSQLVS